MSVINAKMNDSRKENFLGLFFVSDWFLLGVFRCSFVLLGFFLMKVHTSLLQEGMVPCLCR